MKSIDYDRFGEHAGGFPLEGPLILMSIFQFLHNSLGTDHVPNSHPHPEYRFDKMIEVCARDLSLDFFKHILKVDHMLKFPYLDFGKREAD